MKKIITFLFILILVAVGIYYFAPAGQWSAKAPAGGADPIATTEIGGNSGRVLGAQALQRIGSSVQNFASSTGQVLSSSVANFVGGVVADAVQGAKEAIVDQVANVLGVGADFGVCAAYQKDQAVNYLVEFAISTSTPGGAYWVDWGDGQKMQSPATSSPKVVASHAYADAGNYKIIFRSGSSSGNVLAEKEVCVQ